MGIAKKIKEKKQEKRKEQLKHMTEREKVEERREEVLSKGRKFKYPLQYAKHRVVFLTTIISILAVAVLAGLFHFALYKAQSTDDVLYRITRVIPVPVAKFGDASVRYSDYLLIYRSTITPVEQQGQLATGDDAIAMRNHYKRMALTAAEDYAYAEKLARENGVTVSGEDIDKEITRQREAGGTERSVESFEKILNDNFGLSMREYRRMVEMALIKAKVQEKIDITAQNVVSEVNDMVKTGKSLKDISGALSDKVVFEETGGLVDKMNIDGGRANAAMKLEPGKISGAILSSSGDGYYFVKLINKNDTSVNYESLKVSFTEFDKQVKQIREQNNFKEYITIDDDLSEEAVEADDKESKKE